MKLYLSLFIYIIIAFKTYSQEAIKDDGRLFLGLNYGQANQNNLPSNNSSYLYKNQYFKIQINYLLSKKKKISYELHIEPSLYLSEHQLLNKWFIKSSDSPNFEEQREIFTKRRKFNEYVLNIGIIARYELSNNFNVYALGSVGPMIGEQDTERLKKGFAFSDIFGLGVSYKLSQVTFDLRTTLRHNSNADLFFPNHGHNSLGIESGVLFKLK